MDKIQLAQSTEPNSYDVENEDISDLEYVEDDEKIIWMKIHENRLGNKNFYVKIVFLKIPHFYRFPIPVKNLGPENSRSRFSYNSRSRAIP